MFKKQEKGMSLCRVIFTTVSIVLFILAAFAIAYKFFKKHFKVTFESGDCDFCDDDCFCDDPDFEPECSVCDGTCDDDCTCDCDDGADGTEE